MDILAKRQQQVLHDKKWIRLLRRTWLFRLIPFVEFAFAAGSMATGSVHADSDFDVIIGVRSGRIFTARFLSVLAFGLFGWRRAKMSHKESAADKVCLNHFVTEASYRLSPPHNSYWKNLYVNLVPIYGRPEKINAFLEANRDWMGARIYEDDLRHAHQRGSWLQRAGERLLGDRVERRLKAFQVARIEKSFSLEAGYNPRVIYNDDELEFHPHTKRIEEYSRLMK